MPQIDAVQALALRTTRLGALVVRSLAYEGSGMKAKRIEQVDKAIAAEFKTFATDLQALRARAHPDDQAHL